MSIDEILVVKAFAHNINWLGFHWPTVLADAKAYMKKCDRLQRHTPIVRQLLKRLISISSPIPFENVICSFGIPYIIGTDNGQQFDNEEFKDYCNDNNIELRFTSVTHPQRNGQAEVANQIIHDGLKKRFECSKNTWVDELLRILWAYRTTYKVIIEATSFMLSYRAEAVMPFDIIHGSPRVEAYEPKTNEEGMRLTLTLIDEVLDEANARNTEHQRRYSLYYNMRVKERFFQKGNMGLRKIKASGVGEKRKMASNLEGPYKVKKTLG
ncbi:uncharacterized protein LOC141693597 [Apium graveolens]|uniref:uncharacterized protein LOC141693597 n=1 Tax=Apium graveolens TaxID=4045 RepID=UPI003D795D61